MTQRTTSIFLLLFVWQSVSAQLPIARASDRDAPEEARPSFTVIDSIPELRRVMALDHQKIRMKPGVYRVSDAAPDNKTVFFVTGSDNHFDLRGVTLQIDTEVLAGLRGKVHSLATYRVSGSRITIEGALFEDVGDRPPYWSLSDFQVTGDDVTFRDCRFIVRGSAPYGYGDLYGKGAGAAVRLQKHAAISVNGERTLIENCDFRIHTFGHGIHMHGAQDTVIRNVTMEGDLRPTDELYDEKEGLAKKFEHKMMYPPWAKGEPIPRHRMLSLTEDGIRAYVYGDDRDGKQRRTGHVTVEDCMIKRMRGGITICMATSGKIIDCTVVDSGGHAYSVPSDGLVRNCQGNAAYSPLLVVPYKQTRHADIELNLLDSASQMGDHPLALITGDSGHRIRITAAGKPPKVLRPIVIGSVGDRYTAENTDPKELIQHHIARQIQLENLTPHPVRLTEYAIDCRVKSLGPVEDQGEGNVSEKP